jgi:hypothetical protein
MGTVGAARQPYNGAAWQAIDECSPQLSDLLFVRDGLQGASRPAPKIVIEA